MSVFLNQVNILERIKIAAKAHRFGNSCGGYKQIFPPSDKNSLEKYLRLMESVHVFIPGPDDKRRQEVRQFLIQRVCTQLSVVSLTHQIVTWPLQWVMIFHSDFTWTGHRLMPCTGHYRSHQIRLDQFRSDQIRSVLDIITVSTQWEYTSHTDWSTRNLPKFHVDYDMPSVHTFSVRRQSR